MPAVTTNIDTPDNATSQIHVGKPVNIRLTKGASHQVVTGEAYSAPILRGVSRSITVWVQGQAGTDNFRLEMCCFPEFVNGVFDPDASIWARVGDQIDMTNRLNFIAGQTVDDMAYAIRVARVTGSPLGSPDPGNFDVYVWALSG